MTPPTTHTRSFHKRLGSDTQALSFSSPFYSPPSLSLRKDKYRSDQQLPHSASGAGAGETLLFLDLSQCLSSCDSGPGNLNSESKLVEDSNPAGVQDSDAKPGCRLSTNSANTFGPLAPSLRSRWSRGSASSYSGSSGGHSKSASNDTTNSSCDSSYSLDPLQPGAGAGVARLGSPLSLPVPPPSPETPDIRLTAHAQQPTIGLGFQPLENQTPNLSAPAPALRLRSPSGSFDDLLSPSSSLSPSGTHRNGITLLTSTTIQIHIDQEGSRHIRPEFKLVGLFRPTNWCFPSLLTDAENPTKDPFEKQTFPEDCTVELLPVNREIYAFHHSSFDVGLGEPTVRRVMVNGDESRDHVSRQATLTIRATGVYCVSGTEDAHHHFSQSHSHSDRGRRALEWRFEYLVLDRRSKSGKLLPGEKTMTPLSFRCSPAFLDGKNGSKVTIRSVVKKSLAKKRIKAVRVEPPVRAPLAPVYNLKSVVPALQDQNQSTGGPGSPLQAKSRRLDFRLKTILTSGNSKRKTVTKRSSHADISLSARGHNANSPNRPGCHLGRHKPRSASLGGQEKVNPEVKALSRFGRPIMPRRDLMDLVQVREALQDVDINFHALHPRPLAHAQPGR